MLNPIEKFKVAITAGDIPMGSLTQGGATI